MRSLLFSLAAAFVFVVAAPAPQAHAAAVAPAIGHAAHVYALQIPDKKIEITVDKNGVSAHTVKWYQNPVWIAIGVLAVIVLLLLIVLATRGGGTTVIRG